MELPLGLRLVPHPHEQGGASLFRTVVRCGVGIGPGVPYAVQRALLALPLAPAMVGVRRPPRLVGATEPAAAQDLELSFPAIPVEPLRMIRVPTQVDERQK